MPTKLRDPATVVRDAYAALARGDGHTLARILDHDVLKQYRDYWVAGISSWAELTDDARHWPDGSGGTAETGEIDAERLRAHAAMPVNNVDGVRNLGELAALTPSELLIGVVAAWGRAMDNDPAPNILGVVLEGADVAHVLYRLGNGGPARPEIISLRRRNGEWRLLAPLAPGPAWGSPTIGDDHPAATAG